jgi:hypothetical protein
MAIMTDRAGEKTDTDLLISALDYLARWDEMHGTRALQVINFFVLGAAVIGTAYVSALNGHQDTIAGVVALAGGAAAGGTYLIFRRQNNLAHLADEPLREIQGRIADKLEIDSLRVTDRIPFSRQTQWRRSTFIANVGFPLLVVSSFAAALYAWIK